MLEQEPGADLQLMRTGPVWGHVELEEVVGKPDRCPID